MFIAGNAAVPKKTKTTEHIDTLWQYLEIWPRTTYAEFYKLPDLAESPAQAKREKLPPSTRGRIIQFEREALKFCGEKLNIAILKTSGIFQAELTVRAFHPSRDF